MNMQPKFAHRIGSRKLRIAGPEGQALPGAEVTVRQVRHRFLFGCSEFSTLAYASGEMADDVKAVAQRRYRYMADLCNTVTLPFYWGRFEPERGKPDTGRMMNAVRWLREQGIAPKGHPLCWHTSTAPWLLDLSNQEILQAQLARIRRDAGEFAGLVDTWDVINEVVIMPEFDRYDNGITRICKDIGQIQLVKQVFTEAKEANPKATLLINDFVTSQAYADLLDRLLDAGVPIDVIGIQSHMHQGYWGEEKTRRVLERFARFGLPIHFTEINLVSGKLMPSEIVDLNDHQVTDWPTEPEGEERQAREAAAFYDLLFAHPLVQGAVWWSFNDGLWLKAPSGLVRADGSAKPAYDALHSRIKGDWWLTEETHTTDEQGYITVSGCFGDYTACHSGGQVEFSIEP